MHWNETGEANIYLAAPKSQSVNRALEARKWGRSLNYANLDQIQSHKYLNAAPSWRKSSRSFSITYGIWSSTFVQAERVGTFYLNWNFKRALHSLEFSPFAPRQRSQKEIPVLQPRAILTLFLLSINTMLLHLPRKQFYWARAGRAKKQVRKERRKLFKWHVRVVRSLMTLCFSLWTTWFEKELNPFGSRRLLATLFATPMCMHSIDPLWSGNIANNEQRKSICWHRWLLLEPPCWRDAHISAANWLLSALKKFTRLDLGARAWTRALWMLAASGSLLCRLERQKHQFDLCKALITTS